MIYTGEKKFVDKIFNNCGENFWLHNICTCNHIHSIQGHMTHCCRVKMAKQKLAPISGPQCSLPPLSLKYNTVFESSSQMSPIS